MHTYQVQPGDSPAQIAIHFAGCPKCAIDLVRANPDKPSVAYPNGFSTFETLRAGETLNLPDKWFNGDLDSRPPIYFQALPYADGVTPSTLGDAAAGVLGDYAALDAATQRVGALAALDNQSFSNAVGDTGTAINAAIQEAYGSSNAQAAQYAKATQDGTQWAWTRNADLARAIAAGDAATVTQARLDIQNALSTALGNAKLALGALYAQPTPGAGFSRALVSAAQAAVNAISTDVNYCSSVAQSGSAVNAAVHAFKSAWNASQVPAVPINTGNYEAPTAAAIQQVFGSAPAPCSGGRPAPSPAPAPAAPPAVVAPTVPVAAAPSGGLSTGAVVGIGLVAAAAVGGITYVATRRPVAPRGVRR